MSMPHARARARWSILFAALCTLPVAARSQDTPSVDVTDVDQRLRILERKLELKAEADSVAARKAPAFSADSKGFSWTGADGSSSLRIRGYVHSDGRFFSGDEERPAASTFTLRRVRTIVEVTMAKVFDLRIMPDWAGTPSLYDAYVEYRPCGRLAIRTGKFKPPLGYERLRSATALVFVERALPTNLVPNRDVGIQLSGRVGVVEYAAGVFDGTPNGGAVVTDSDDDKEWIGRVFAYPLRNGGSPLKNLGLGFSASLGDAEGTPSSTGLSAMRSPGQASVFSYRSNGRTADSTVVAAGRRVRWSPQGELYAGRVGAFAEYVRSSEEIRIGTATLDHEMRSWAVTGSVVLTRDTITDRGVTPKKPLDGATGGKGAVAVDARYSVLRVDGAAFPVFASAASSVSEARSVGLGATWFLNRNVKLVADVEETRYDGGAAAGGDREKERVLFIRTQFSY